MTKPHWNVLIFPGGMENGIEIYNSLKNCKEISLFSASSAVPNQAFFLYKNNHIVRDVREDGWIEDLNAVIDACHIDIVYPANSFIIDALAANKDRLHAPVLLPSQEVLQITRSKHQTIRRLSGCLPLPLIYSKADDIKTYPVFAKPDNGYGAQGTRKIENRQEAEELDFSRFVVQELLPGKEYTVDCLSDNEANLLFCAGRERSRIRMGTSMHAQAVSAELDTFFAQIAREILKKIKISGAWFFQMKEDAAGNLKLLEIDVRIAGTMCYNRCRGVNFALLSLYLFFGLPVKLSLNNIPLILDRSLRNRYLLDYVYDTVYVDLDDTIVCKGLLNTDMIKFLYQAFNQGKKLVLISKHLGQDKKAYLQRWRIDSLFDEVIWLQEHEDKYQHMNSKRAIYIDDSFSQRYEAAQKLGIPTFDASMIECLLDERIAC